MIISEKQIMGLMTIANDFQIILINSKVPEAKNKFEEISKLLNNISNQQSAELKVVE